MKKIIDKISAHLRQRMHDQVIAAAPWYVGDPGYIIPDDQWDDFCDLTYKHSQRRRGSHIDSVIDWHGQEITIWTNGGDGTWTFTGLQSASGATSFGVDSGIFCVINLNDLPAHEAVINDGILFEHEPDLEVKDGVVYIQPAGQRQHHDNSVHECDNCGSLVQDSWYDDEEDEDRCDNCW